MRTVGLKARRRIGEQEVAAVEAEAVQGAVAGAGDDAGESAILLARQRMGAAAALEHDFAGAPLGRPDAKGHPVGHDLGADRPASRHAYGSVPLAHGIMVKVKTAAWPSGSRTSAVPA